ncbi:fasciclin domain-containing protein [Pedobacter punctiformis]|uniref:Fasciclin domain-containing protein n=1 Tax=Pedobacter punctiformis TaxID=3004097 RepID=A0ABT4LAA8_9SPHI|nr:fasciclin domain-containing protein [Pedobacter sp. HCMS5-2]MCZ4244861.1 fasciclin domain-containing protein [Pedobacter sp. HCMS5-2]
MFKIFIKTAVMVLLAAVLFASCKKNDYYYDTGVHAAEYNGTILSYLKSKPVYFDTLTKVINIAGMNDVFEKENVTFFAPTSSTIYKSLNRLNTYLKLNGRDTVSQLTQIKPSVWKETLSMYVFKGTSRLKDYPQIDTLSLLAFPGQGYTSYQGRTMNIGVLYRDAGGVKYAGYRQLILSFIPDYANPRVGLVNVPIASSDIAPTNGIVHVLVQNKHNFGFNTDRFINTAVSSGILPPTP